MSWELGDGEIHSAPRADGPPDVPSPAPDTCNAWIGGEGRRESPVDHLLWVSCSNGETDFYFGTSVGDVRAHDVETYPLGVRTLTTDEGLGTGYEFEQSRCSFELSPGFGTVRVEEAVGSAAEYPMGVTDDFRRKVTVDMEMPEAVTGKDLFLDPCAKPIRIWGSLSFELTAERYGKDESLGCVCGL